jgi:hypothetical protein
MGTATGAARTGRLAAGRRCLLASLLLTVASVAADIWVSRLSDGIVRERERTCDGMLPMPESVLVLMWVGVGLAAAAVAAAVVGRALIGPRGRNGLADAVLPALAGAIVAGVAATLTLAWPITMVVVVLVIVAAASWWRLRSGTADPSPIRGTSDWLVPVALAGALLAVALTLFTVGAVHSDAPTQAHLCSG